MTDVKTNQALPYLMGNKTFDVRLGIEREHSFVGFFRSLRMALPVEPASRQKITQSPETKQTLLLKALFNRGFFLAPRWVHMI